MLLPPRGGVKLSRFRFRKILPDSEENRKKLGIMYKRSCGIENPCFELWRVQFATFGIKGFITKRKPQCPLRRLAVIGTSFIPLGFGKSWRSFSLPASRFGPRFFRGSKRRRGGIPRTGHRPKRRVPAAFGGVQAERLGPHLVCDQVGADRRRHDLCFDALLPAPRLQTLCPCVRSAHRLARAPVHRLVSPGFRVGAKFTGRRCFWRTWRLWLPELPCMCFSPGEKQNGWAWSCKEANQLC